MNTVFNKMIMIFFFIVTLSPLSLKAMKFVQTLKTNRENLEKQIVVLTKAGDDLLVTGSLLQKQLIDEVGKQQKELGEKKELLTLPYSIVIEPFKFFEAELAKEAQKHVSDPVAVSFYGNLIVIIRGELFQKTYNALFLLSLQVAKIPALPDVLKNLMALLDKVDVTMGSVKSKFDPIVHDMCSYVDIEKAKAALGLPANSYSAANLEFVNKYRDYVNKVYAEKTGGGKFDARGVYSGLWKAIENFRNAVIKMKNLEKFFSSFKF